ncbi:MAG TPA: hypothetical protein VK172_10500 [Lentimicrobium sp.]|nr:hypothetical protein [Lentimicrobium sp.]
MKKLTVSKNSFTTMLSGIIESGVTFEAKELPNGLIEVIFTGGY